MKENFRNIPSSNKAHPDDKNARPQIEAIPRCKREEHWDRCSPPQKPGEQPLPKVTSWSNLAYLANGHLTNFLRVTHPLFS